MKLGHNAFAFVLLIVLQPPCASAQDETQTTAVQVDARKALRDARSTFDFGQYRATVDKLTPIVVPAVLLAARTEISDAYTLLGLSHFFLGEKSVARQYFERLLEYSPDAELDPVKIPPPAVSFFQDLKERKTAELEQKKAELKRQREEEARRQAEANTRRVRYVYQERSKIAAFLPFGVGQFQNQQPVLGTILLGSQVASISVSIAAFLAVENLRTRDGRFRNADVEQARSIQRLQLYSAAAASVLIAGGIVQALWAFEPTRFVEQQELSTPPPPAQLTPNGFIIRF